MTRRRLRWLQLALVAAALLPALSLALRAAFSDLGAEPVETLTHATGEWALRLLLATLAVTPARRLLGWAWLAPLRRTLGLLAFGYASVHLLVFLVLEHFFEWAAIVEDVLERRYITVGFAAWLLLVPLAATSTRAAVRRLGRRWVVLHRLVYAAAVGGVVHYLWLVKADARAPLIYAGALALLLGYRLWARRARSSAVRPGSGA